MVGPIARTILTFSIIGDDLDPNDLTALLKLDPTRTGRKGDPVYGSDGTVFRRKPRGIWQFELHSNEQVSEPKELITELLNRLPIGSKPWAAIVSQFELDATCALFMENSNEGLFLSPELCDRVAAAGITLGFDIYAPDISHQRL